MRSAAHRRQDEAPEPPSRDLAAEAGALMDQARALLPVLEARGDARAVNEVIILGLRFAELASAMEDAAAGESVVEAAYLRGRADEAAAAQQPSRPRHAARGRHLKLAGIPATAARTAVASVVVAAGLGGGLAAGQSVQVQVTDGPGVAGWLYVSYGTVTAPVPVTSSLQAPAVALP